MKKSNILRNGYVVVMVVAFLIGFQSGVWKEKDKVTINKDSGAAINKCSRILSWVDKTLRECTYQVELLRIYADIRPGEHAEVCRQCHSHTATHTYSPDTPYLHDF